MTYVFDKFCKIYTKQSKCRAGYTSISIFGSRIKYSHNGDAIANHNEPIFVGFSTNIKDLLDFCSAHLVRDFKNYTSYVACGKFITFCCILLFELIKWESKLKLQGENLYLVSKCEVLLY